MTDAVLAARSRFPLLGERRYFASQCLGPLPRDVQQDLDEYVRTLHLRSRSIGPWIQAMFETTRAIEELLGAAPGSVGLHGSATAAQGTIAACLEPRGERRRIVISTIDFHSSRYLWAAQERRGFEIVEIAPADGRGFQPEELAAVLDERVAAIAIAMVSPRTGALLDAARLVAAARRAGALVILDAFQAVGVVPIDVGVLDPDVLVGGLYKWMCGGGTGLAFAYVRPELAAGWEPAYPGWIGHRDVGGFHATAVACLRARGLRVRADGRGRRGRGRGLARRAGHRRRRAPECRRADRASPVLHRGGVRSRRRRPRGRAGARGRPEEGTGGVVEAAELQRLVVGYALSASLFTAVELGVFDATAGGPAIAAALAARLDAAPAPLERLLELLAALGLLDRTEDGYRATELARAALTVDGPASLVPVLSHQWKHFYALFAHLPASIRAGRPQASLWAFARGEDDGYRAMANSAPELERFLAAMDRSSAGTGTELAARVDLTSSRRLVDLGGGGGAVALELAAALPELAITLVDLELACAYAERRIRGAGASERVRCIPGDARDAAWAREVGGADVVLLSAVLADWSADERALILSNVHAALDPGGRVVISETLLSDDVPGPVVPAMLSLCLLLASNGASLRPSELHALVAAAGFTDIELLPPGSNGRSLLVARKQITT
ncbi:aminotransferase class V-fold PLP-dependent enzyme [Sorangium sp. So ce327]|uniref:aminotransferase class V-fold PLP-dependent enzyme n=1 Tax=Sorangium sp. So ce327 TaxID=3133301 RepID=UPI003F5DD8D6